MSHASRFVRSAARAPPRIALPAAAQEVTLKVHHFWAPTAMPPSTLLTPWCDKIAKDSNNRMKCQIYPAMQLGGAPPQLIQQAMDGVADIVWTLPGYTAGRFPVDGSVRAAVHVAKRRGDEPGGVGVLHAVRIQGVPGIKALAVNVHDNGYIHTVSKQVKVMADFKGLKMRAPTRQTNKLLGALGATPVAMPLPALGDALSKGRGRRLHAAVGSDSVDQGAHEFTKFESETDPKVRALYTAVFILAMNQAKYDSLPADLKQRDRRELGAALSRRRWA